MDPDKPAASTARRTIERVNAAVVSATVLVAVLALSSPGFSQDLTVLPRDHPEIRVVSITGETTAGVLRRFDASTVVLDIDGQDRVFHKSSIGRIYQDDPLRNGLLRGLAAGLAIGAVTTLRECEALSSPSHSCSKDELLFVFGFIGSVFGGAGLGIGAAIDALVHRQQLLFVGAPAAATPPVTFHLDHDTARLAFHVRW